jgi:hypothetical protein
MPGGFGTLDEFFEVLTLVQTRRISRFPLILFGRSYWTGLLKWMKVTLEKNSLISVGDLDLVQMVDTPEEAVDQILDYIRRVGPPDEVPTSMA